MSFKFLFYIFFAVTVFSAGLKEDNSSGYEEDMEELESVKDALDDSKRLYSSLKYKPMLTSFNVWPTDITQRIGELVQEGPDSKRAFRRLVSYADNMEDGTNSLKNNLQVKNALKLMTQSPIFKDETKLRAAKLAARLNNVPVSLQKTEPDITKKAKDLSSTVVVPRMGRIYRPDRIIENYKAGNWGA